MSIKFGGQALIEGVMIRGRQYNTVAVRCPDGSINIKSDSIGWKWTSPYRKIPFLRGILVLAETLYIGTKSLLYSSAVSTGESSDSIRSSDMIIVLTLSISIAIIVFFLTPLFAASFISRFLSPMWIPLIEGVLRVSFFIIYLLLIRKSKDVRRVFQYHAAEHMSIHAHEHDEDLIPSNVRKYAFAHPRCGTAFLLIVFIISFIVFNFVGHDPLWWMFLSRIVLILPIAGCSYELIHFAALNSSNLIGRFINKPSLALQSLTTDYPDDAQIEVAIAAMMHAREVKKR
ncbi:MAG: membrane protein [Chloroflexota bacterium]|nr:MAG: membrane protein [Chloroflexota bacterium]